MAEFFELTHNAQEIAKALAAKPAVILAALDRAFARGANEIADAEKIAAPKFRTMLTNSVLFGRKSESPLEYDVTANAKHGVFVDEGTGPGGRPPLEETIAWIRAKRITPNNPRMSERNLAKLIRLRIAQHGIPAANFWGPTFESKVDRLNELCRASVAQALAAPS